MENVSTSSSIYFVKQVAKAWKNDKTSLANITFEDSSIEECCLTREHGIVMSEPDKINHNDQKSKNDYIKATFGITDEIGPIKSNRRFFKSSRKRQFNAQEIIMQESFERGSYEVTDDELFYPDCNMSKIMRVENGKIKIKREWKKMFQVVEHVRDSHLIHEIGEDQESKNDLEYFIDGIVGEHSQKVKVYSALSLVKKSTQSAFRSCLRASHSTADLTKLFESFHSNQKLCLCFCCLMMILIKSYPQDDFSLLIDHLLVLHDSTYPIYDRETLKMIDILRDSCNSIKDKILPTGDTWTLLSRDIEVQNLSEILIFMLSSRDGKLLENPQIIDVVLVSVHKHLHNVIDAWDENHFLCSEDVFGRLHVKLSLLSKWLQVARANNLKECIKKEFVQHLISTCSVCVEAVLKPVDKRTIFKSEANFFNGLVEILRCLGQIVLREIKEHLSAFNNNFYEQLILFILFLDSQKELPQLIDLLILSLEMVINLTKAGPKFTTVLKKNLSNKAIDYLYKPCKMGIQCLAKLFERNYEFVMAKKTIRKKKVLKDKLKNSSYLKVKQIESGNSWRGEFEAIKDTSSLGGLNDSSFSVSSSLKSAESSMNNFIITSYIAALIGVASYQSPKLVDNFLHLLPSMSFEALSGILEDFLQFMLECKAVHCHDFLLLVIAFLKNYSKD